MQYNQNIVSHFLTSDVLIGELKHGSKLVVSLRFGVKNGNESQNPLMRDWTAVQKMIPEMILSVTPESQHHEHVVVIGLGIIIKTQASQINIIATTKS